jgi:hypothetical protein
VEADLKLQNEGAAAVQQVRVPSFERLLWCGVGVLAVCSNRGNEAELLARFAALMSSQLSVPI